MLPPVHTPVTVGAIARGARVALGAGEAWRDELARTLVARLDRRHVLLTDSGTSALLLALRLATARRPGPVALPAFACYDLATAAVGAGVTVLPYDVDPATLAPDLDSLRSALRAGAGTVVVVHLFGVPVPLDELRREVAAAGAVLVEDAAQGHGGAWAGRPLGAHGDLAVLSFGRGKGMTGGRGGALVADVEWGEALDAAGASLARAPGAGGDLVRLAAQWVLARPALYALPASLPGLRLGETVYHEPWPPAAMPPAAAAALLAVLPAADRAAPGRRAVAERLLTACAEAGVEPVRVPEGAEPGWLRFPLLAAPGVRERRRDALARWGVLASYPRPLADVEALGPRLVARPATPGASVLAARLVTLPTHRWVRERELAALGVLMGELVRGEPGRPSRD